MKKLLKKLLQTVGIYNTVVNLRYYLKYNKYQHYKLIYDKLEITYSTEDNYSKRWFYPRYIGGKVHEPAVIDFFIKNLKENFVFCDVGANLGFFTCIGAQLCNSGHVHAFEMDPKCIPLINKNLIRNNFDNVDINNNAVSDKVGIEIIPNLSKPDPRLMIKGDNQDLNNTIEIESISLDEYFINQRNIMPDLLKIDAEGAEIKILRGMKGILKDSKYLKILVEIHCTKITNFGASYTDVLNILDQNGFSMHLIDSHRLNNLNFKKINSKTILSGNVMVFAEK